jgi:ribosomal peptide maturation radical SAM protein 1
MMFRSKSVTRVGEEITGLAGRYKTLNFVAVDDIIDLAHVRDLLPLLSKSGYDLQLFYETKANLTKNQSRAFLRAGVTAMQPGIESLSTPILRLMKKGVTALQNVRLLKWCAEIGIVPAWNLLYGFPGEPIEEYDRMARLIPALVHFEPPSFSPVQVQRFSPYFERPSEFGIEVTGPQPQYRFLYAVPPEAIADIAYDFDHRYLDGRDIASYTDGVREAVRLWQDYAAKGSGTLSYRRGPNFLIVQERRQNTEPADFRFDGPEAKIYLACDAGASPAELRRQLSAAGEDLEEQEITEFLNELVDARLV